MMTTLTVSEQLGSPISSSNYLFENEVPAKSTTPIPSGIVLKTCSIKFVFYIGGS